MQQLSDTFSARVVEGRARERERPCVCVCANELSCRAHWFLVGDSQSAYYVTVRSRVARQVSELLFAKELVPKS